MIKIDQDKILSSSRQNSTIDRYLNKGQSREKSEQLKCKLSVCTAAHVKRHFDGRAVDPATQALAVSQKFYFSFSFFALLPRSLSQQPLSFPHNHIWLKKGI